MEVMDIKREAIEGVYTPAIISVGCATMERNTDMHKYFVGYDYGIGGIWCYIVAPSKEAILEKYQYLQVWQKTPKFVDKFMKTNLNSKLTYTLDSIPDYVHDALLESKKYKHIR